MLDRLSTAISETQEIVNIIARELSETKDIVNGNARVIQALANTAAEAAEERKEAAKERERIFQVIEQQQAEIRGLQTENQRILDILLNERQQDEPPEN